jgi:hypothetical protein
MGLDGMTGGISVKHAMSFVHNYLVYNGRGGMDRIGSV